MDKNMLREALQLVKGPLNQLLTNLGGYDGEAWLKEFKKFLRKEKCWTVPGRFFMTVTLGSYPSVAELKKAILSSGKKVSDYAGQILDKIEISSEKIEVELWEVTGAELGFTEAVSRSTIYQRVLELGFEKSPAEGIALSRIKCEDKKLRIGGMEPVFAPDSVLLSLDIFSGNIFWLNAFHDFSDYLWSPDDVWLFVRPRRK